jgi:ribosomal protein L37AE/L43A
MLNTNFLILKANTCKRISIDKETMSQRGRGSCPNCKAQYFNRYKPSKCGMCGYALGGTFEPSTKKVKYSPRAVEISKGIYSVTTSTRDDRCFVTTDGNLWFCSLEECKIARSVQHNSSRLAEFSCRHVDEVKFCDKSPPVAILKPDLDNFVCSETLRNSIQDVLNVAGSMPMASPAVQVSDAMFCAFGPITASNPLGYCHVRKSATELNHFICTGKDCRGFAAKGKQVRTKSMCMHIAILHSCFVTNTLDTTGDTNNNVTFEAESSTEPGPTVNSSELTKRLSTLSLAEKVKILPYILPHDLLQSVAKRDACTLLGVGEMWPNSFIPDLENCQLRGSVLGDTCIHPGQSRNNPCYLLTELNPFKQVDIKVKFCSSRACYAMHQASVEKLGRP